MKIFILSLVLTIPFSNGGDHGEDDGGGDRGEPHPPPEKDDGGDFADAESDKGNQRWQPDHDFEDDYIAKNYDIKIEILPGDKKDSIWLLVDSHYICHLKNKNLASEDSRRLC